MFFMWGLSFFFVGFVIVFFGNMMCGIVVLFGSVIFGNYLVSVY